MDKKAIRYNC